MDRKRVTKLVTGLLLVGMIFLVGRTCHSEHADITLVFSSASGEPIEAFEVSVLRDTEVVAKFEASLGKGAQKKWKHSLDPGSYTLDIEITRDGKLERRTRRLEAVPRATVRVEL